MLKKLIYRILHGSVKTVQLVPDRAAMISEDTLQPPWYYTKFTESLGTLGTAAYQAIEGVMQMQWPNKQITQLFDNFKEENKLITYIHSESSLAF